jgi:hypothetical protein
MEFAAGVQKLLQRIVLGRNWSDCFVKRRRDPVLVALVFPWV